MQDDNKSQNMVLWETIRNVDKAFLEPYPTEDGRILTGINVMHGRALFTAIFGPCGTDWGYDDSDWVTRGNVLTCKVTLWYKPHLIIPSYPAELVARVSEFGGAKLNGDADVCKKALTSALKRCFMALGHGADIYAGLYDQNNPENQAELTLPPVQTGEGFVGPAAANEMPEDLPTIEDKQQIYLDKILERQPLFQMCERRIVDGYVYFLIDETQAGEHLSDLEALGFKESTKYPGGRFFKLPLPHGAIPASPSVSGASTHVRQ